MKADGSKGQTLQQSPIGDGIIDGYKLLIFDNLIVDASSVCLDHPNDQPNNQYFLHLNIKSSIVHHLFILLSLLPVDCDLATMFKIIEGKSLMVLPHVFSCRNGIHVSCDF